MNETGTLEPNHKSGRRPKTDKTTDRGIKSLVVQNRFIFAAHIKQQLNIVSVNVTTIKRRLKEKVYLAENQQNNPWSFYFSIKVVLHCTNLKELHALEGQLTKGTIPNIVEVG